MHFLFHLVILPVSNNTPQTTPTDPDVCPASIPIEPIVFSIDSEGMTFISKMFQSIIFLI